jgi:signal transduction histidine kinase
MELDDPQSTRLFRTIANVGFVREMLAREDTILVNASVTGRLSPADRAAFAQAVGARRVLLAEAPAELDGDRRAAFADLVRAPALATLQAIENRLVDAPATGPVPVTSEAWATAYRDADHRLGSHEQGLDDALAQRADAVASTYYWRLGLTGAIGLAAILFSVVVSVRVGRSLVRRLRGLRSTALELAERRLPNVVTRLRHGENVDVAAEAPPLSFGEIGNDEISDVGQAFSQVQRTAVESAIQEASVRRGLNEVFLNIARRSQTLLHRQLTLLDRMERRTSDPDDLEDLFRVDHMATRMRRHAEDLVILAGSAPGRKWRQPVPLVDVIRGAVSEVEDYARVQVIIVPDVTLVGRAVTDLIHLLAELLENATSYSPPHTKVTVSAELVPHGFVVEIEDRGLGMTEDEIDDANARLREPPDFDPANSARLGLFVVALLAGRLGAQITLRRSPYGGVTAVVLVPRDLIDNPPTLSVAAEQRGAPIEQRGAPMEQRPVAALSADPVAALSADPVAALSADPVAALSADRAPEAPMPVPEPKPVPAPTLAVHDVLDAGLTEDGLPRRVRGMDAYDDEPSTVGTMGRHAAPMDGALSTEDMRAKMSAFQAGTARGRRDAQASIHDLEQET